MVLALQPRRLLPKDRRQVEGLVQRDWNSALSEALMEMEV